MRQDTLLHPDLADSARTLIAQGRLLAEREPELYRAAARGRAELARFFATELGWTLDVLESADMIRLHKRRQDVPSGRGPRLRREGRETALAPRLVLILSALVCEQLWRRPRMTLNDLLQATAQVCAADSESGLLPRFVVVAGDGVSKREAHDSRQSLVDALRLLQADGTITVDADLDRAASDDASDLVVAASRDRLTAKFSSLSPSLLKLTQLPPQRHAPALTADLLLEDGELLDEPAPTLGDDSDEKDLGIAEPRPSADSRAARAETTRRRQRAIRRLVDDPGLDPMLDDYLQTSTGRNRALNVLHALGLVGTVRRDWWQVSDPTGLGSALDFPNGRRSERQAALALLQHLGSRELTVEGGESPVAIADIVSLFEGVRAELPRWAAAYDRRFSALARAAAAELVNAGFLLDVTEADEGLEGSNDEMARRWQPTPAVRIWRIKLHASVSANAGSEDKPVATSVDEAHLALFDGREGDT
jgi:hypothetical protein